MKKKRAPIADRRVDIDIDSSLYDSPLWMFCPAEWTTEGVQG